MRVGFRERLSRSCGSLGFTSLLEAVARKAILTIWNFHRVGDPRASDFDEGVFSATAEQFDLQTRALGRVYDVIGQDELLSILDRPERLRRPTVHLTFDDGYVDNYRVAFPILRARGLSATFFLPTHYIGSSSIPWWDAVAWAIRRSQHDILRLDYPENETVPIDRPRGRQAVRRVLSIGRRTGVEPVAFLAAVSRATGQKLPGKVDERLFLDWDEAKEMVAGGMSVGSHGHTHMPFDTLCIDQQRQELETSALEIQRNLGRRPRAFAFPLGARRVAGTGTEQVLREAGYECAFTFRGGLNRGPSLSRYNLCRVGTEVSCSVDRFRLRASLAAALGLEMS